MVNSAAGVEVSAKVQSEITMPSSVRLVGDGGEWGNPHESEKRPVFGTEHAFNGL